MVITVTDTVTMATLARDLPMKEPLLPLDPMLMLQPTPGMVTMGMVDTGEDTEVTTDHTDIMATTERDLLMKLPLLNLAPTPTPRPTPGMDTMVTDTGLTDMVITVTDTMVTMARDLPMREPLNLDPTPMLILQPTPGMVTTGSDTGVTTGVKKWTSRTTSDLSLPTHL